MTAVFATKISAFDPENISQRVLLTKERLYAIDQLNGEGRQQSFAAALLLMRCPVPAVSVTAFIGVAVPLGWAVIRK